MKIKSLILLTIATLCCTALSAKVITTVNIKDSIQAGETYLFIDKLVNTEGNYSYTFDRSSESKPDSTINLSLKTFVPKQNIAVAYKDSIVEGETYLFIDQLLTEGGEYSATIARKAVPGDSTITLTLSLMPNCQDTMVAIADSIIKGETYLFIDTLLTTEGTYYRTLPRVAGCDSTIALTLSLMPNCQDTMVAIADSIIDGEMYLFIDTLLTSEGTYYRTLPRVAGCDSTIALTLSLMPACSDTAVAYTDSIFVGESYLFIDTLITMNNADTVTCQRTLPRVAGCDSTINLTLIARYVYTRNTLRDTISDSLCYKEAFTDRLGVTYYPAQDTVVMDTISDVLIDTVGYTITTYDSIYRYELKVWPAMTTTTQTDSLCADYGSFTWNLGSRDSIITDFVTGVNHREYMYQNILGCDSAKFVLDVTVWPAMTTTTQTDSLCADYGSFTWNLGSRDSIITDFTIDAVNHREYMYKNILGGDSAKFVLDVTVWPATKYPTAVKDTIDEDKLPYEWRPYEGVLNQIYVAGVFYDTVKNVLDCDSIIYELDLAVRTVTRHEAEPVDTNVCKGTDYVGRLTTHTINGLTEWQDSLRLREGLTAIDSIYKYKVDTLPTKIPDSEISHIKAFCDYPVDYSYAWLNVAEFVNPYFIFAEITDTIWEVETKAGWNPAATTILTSEDKTIRVRCTVVTECETTYSTSEPYEVKVASADDKPEELTIPAAQKYGSRIIMIDKKATTEGLGWTISEADVTWYQVVDEPDDRSYDSNPATWNDMKVGEGQYYYNLDNGGTITGQYYAIVAGATKGDKMACGADLRTPILSCNLPQGTLPSLAPNLVAPNENMTLSGLDATQNYTIRVIGLDGSAVNTLNVNGNEKLNLKAAPVQGMYIVNVWNGQENVSLKYIVK